MTPGEALEAVTAALRAHGLPGNAGLRLADRTFIVGLRPEDHESAPKISELLEAMGCTVTVDRDGYVYGKLAGRLLPAPAVQVSSADSCSAVDSGQPVPVKKCNGPCGRVLPLEAFPWRSKARGYRGPYCGECDRERQRQLSAARAVHVEPLVV